MSNKLAYIPLPWTISPSGSFLQLQAQEGSRECQLHFRAYFVSKEARIASGASEIVYTHLADGSKHAAPLQAHLTITFKDPVYTCLQRMESDGLEEEGVFDFSKLPLSEYPVTPQEYVRKSNDFEIRTGNSSSPGFYEVQDSVLINRFDKTGKLGFKHYVIAGRDFYAEIIATGWSWHPFQVNSTSQP